MTSGQMTDTERRKLRADRLDLYQRAVDDRRNYCTVLREHIETLETVVRLYRESDLHVSGTKTDPVIGAGTILPTHAEVVSAIVSCRDARKAEQERRSAAGAALLSRGVFALFMGLFARGCVSPVLSSGGQQPSQHVPRVFPAASRASKRHRIPLVCPPRARSLLDIRAAFWYGSMGRGTDL